MIQHICLNFLNICYHDFYVKCCLRNLNNYFHVILQIFFFLSFFCQFFFVRLSIYFSICLFESLPNLSFPYLSRTSLLWTVFPCSNGAVHPSAQKNIQWMNVTIRDGPDIRPFLDIRYPARRILFGPDIRLY